MFFLIKELVSLIIYLYIHGSIDFSNRKDSLSSINTYFSDSW